MRGSNTAGVYVPPELNQAKWLLLGEAPGEDEALQGRPFVGPTGRYVDGFLQRFNFSRRDFDITNVVPFRPPKNNLMSWIYNNHEHVKQGLQELDELLRTNKYEAVFALGWFALFAMTGKRGISEHRGSVYSYTIDGEVAGHVIGTYHPALMFKSGDKSVRNLTPGGIANIIFRDLAKFKRMVTEGVPVPPHRTLVLHPTQDDLEELGAYVEERGAVAVDIEVDRKTKELQLIGFAPSPGYAVVISPETLNGQDWAQRILAGEQDKVFHNQPFDDNYIRYHLGWEVNGKLHDTMLMHHVLCPELPRDLGFCCSIYTDEPYFKALGKETGDEFKRYNALDVSTTFEIFEKLRAKLPMVGMQDTYEADRKMLDLAGRMSRRGIRYDVEEAKVFKNSLEHRWKRWQAVLDGRVKRLFEWESKNPTRKLDTLKFDEAVNVMSPPQSKKLLYDLMGLPEQKLKDPKTGKMKVTTQQTKLLMLYPTILDREIKKILRAFLMLRGVRKLWSSYAKTKVGKDQRMRTTVNPGAAETGRWTASAFLIDYEGTNLQTVPPPWKRCFIADEGKLLFMADYSQIEARIVGYDAEDMDQIAIFEDPEGDIHKFNAARLLSIDIHDVTAHQRQYVGKSTHALNYDVGPRTLAEFTNKRGLESGIFVTVDFTREAKRLYLGTFDKVIRWQKRQWNKVKETKVLTNHLGRRRIFLGPTSGQFAYITRGEAIAFVPQSDVPDMLNIAMLRLDEIDDYNLELMLQAHDAVLGQADEDSVEEWSELVKKLMTVPLTIHGREMIVPVDIKVGKRWNKLTTVEKYLELR